MSNAVRELLLSFESLSETDKSEVIAEVIRRAPSSCMGDLADDTLVTIAEELFQTMDQEESRNADA